MCLWPDPNGTRLKHLPPTGDTHDADTVAPSPTGVSRGRAYGAARGAASFTTGAISAAVAVGCTGTIVARADSGLYCAAFTGACRRAGAFFSVIARMDPAVKAEIAAIPAGAWTPIRYPRAIWDDQLGPGYRTPRSPRSPIPRSPRGKARRSSPG